MMLRAVFLVALLLLGGCGGCSSPKAQDSTRTSTIAERLPLSIDGVRLDIQIAVTKSEQAHGLMFRNELADGDGMIFVYKEPQRMSFWMNNVPIPLSVGFFDREGVLKEILHMLPRDTRTVFSSGDRVQYALEMDDGWFERHGVRPGARMDMTLLAAALKARGESPKAYGIK
ncbi:MAG: DUF192 domain-containing protein [Opitutales bacterium]|jgi:hypothetical protein